MKGIHQKLCVEHFQHLFFFSQLRLKTYIENIFYPYKRFECVKKTTYDKYEFQIYIITHLSGNIKLEIL